MTRSQLTRLINWTAMLVSLVMLALVSYQVYLRHFTQLEVGRNYQFDDLPTLDEAPVSADIAAIIDQHVFGVVPKKLDAAPIKVVKEVPKPAPKTRLNIKLTGVIDGMTPETGMAMLEVDRGRTLVVSVGETIDKTDAVLHQVLPGEILIDRDGTIESVKMVRKSLSVAKLDTALLDSLPQPYVAENDPNYQEILTPAPAQINPAADDGEIRVKKKTGVPAMRTLPIPRALR